MRKSEKEKSQQVRRSNKLCLVRWMFCLDVRLISNLGTTITSLTQRRDEREGERESERNGGTGVGNYRRTEKKQKKENYSGCSEHD